MALSLQSPLMAITDSSHLTQEQLKQLECFINEVFAKMPDGIGCTDLVKYVIKTTSDPIKHRPLFRSMLIMNWMICYSVVLLSRLLLLGLSPILLVKKRNGSYRFCVDYRKVNKVTERDAYQLPQVTNTLDKLRDVKYLSSLDIKSTS